MILVYFKNTNGVMMNSQISPGQPLPKDLLWIDLIEPTEAEEKYIESVVEVNIPTRQEAWKIEVMSRFTDNNGVIFLTASVVSRADTDAPCNDAITFILTNKLLITCRYSLPKSFDHFAVRVQRASENFKSPEIVLAGLLDSMISRLAEIIEGIGEKLDTLSADIFKSKGVGGSLQEALKRIGAYGELLTKVTESLHSTTRLVSFCLGALENKLTRENKTLFRNLFRDAQALKEQSNFLTQEMNFLLNASLGLLSVQQNDIIKIFSVAAVIFLPPTLIASIYGMNFELMPELKFHLGYPMALLMMVISAILPYVYFKKKKWL